MAVKCNIVYQALGKLYELQYGTSCSNKDNLIVENYIENLDCSEIDFVACGPKDTATRCTDAIVFKCSFRVTKITIVTQEDITITYGLESVGGKAPYTYDWQIDTSDFDISGPINHDSAIFTVKAGKDLALLVSPVSVTVTDADGCRSTKTCTLTPEGLKCSVNYVACPNTSNLQVTSNFTFCARPHGLVLSNFVP